MRKVIHCAVLAAAMGGLVVAGGGVGLAQPAKKDAPKAKGATTAPAPAAEPAAGGTVEVTKDVKGQFRFKVVGADDKTIMQCSKGYETKADALKALEEAKAILAKGKVVEVEAKEKDKK